MYAPAATDPKSAKSKGGWREAPPQPITGVLLRRLTRVQIIRNWPAKAQEIGGACR